MAGKNASNAEKISEDSNNGGELTGAVHDRYRIICEDLQAGRSVRYIRKKYEIHSTTIKNAVRWYRDRGNTELVVPETVPDILARLQSDLDRASERLAEAEHAIATLIASDYMIEETIATREGDGLPPSPGVESDGMTWRMTKKKVNGYKDFIGASHCARWWLEVKMRIEETMMAWQNKLPAKHPNTVEVTGEIRHTHEIVEKMTDAELEAQIVHVHSLIPRLTAGEN